MIKYRRCITLITPLLDGHCCVYRWQAWASCADASPVATLERQRPSGFARFRFPPEMITSAVRWHLRCHGEAEGLFGSSQHVAALNTTKRERIRAVINMDMIATKNTTNRSCWKAHRCPSRALTS